MTDEQKDKLVEEVMQGFDFQQAYSILFLTKGRFTDMPTLNEFKEQAEKYLRMALEHHDREFWWAGGMHRGGLCACYDDKWGVVAQLYRSGKKSTNIKRITNYDTY